MRYTPAELIEAIKVDLGNDAAAADARAAAGQDVEKNRKVAETCRIQLKILAETTDIKLDRYGWPTCLPK